MMRLPNPCGIDARNSARFNVWAAIGNPIGEACFIIRGEATWVIQPVGVSALLEPIANALVPSVWLAWGMEVSTSASDGEHGVLAPPAPPSQDGAEDITTGSSGISFALSVVELRGQGAPTGDVVVA
jgi:hypothetical protein